MTVRNEIHRLVEVAFERAQSAGELPPLELPDFAVERPARPEHGDFAVSLALRLARAARLPPLRIAEAISRHLDRPEFLARVEVAPPGFINFFLDDRWLCRQVDAILAAGPDYGRVSLGPGLNIQVEFVSANPVGPLHVGNGRGAVLGSTLANILELAGHRVTREYYINDAGSQMDAFYRSLWARYLQALGHEAEFPADGYPGQYLVEVAQEIVAEHGDRFARMPEAEGRLALGKLGVEKVLGLIRRDLADLRVNFDFWYSEQSLYDSGLFDKVLKLLRDRGFVEEREGALWFVSTALGEDKDNVLIRSNGLPTYFASDIAYHYDKFAIRKFDRVIDIWGADHQGHVPRMKAAVQALGFDPDRLVVILTQMVTLRRGAEVVRLSKRTGEVITLREVIDEVGPDACRYFFLSRSADTQMDFDLELAKQQTQENPVYYIQYAHARICSILRNAAERGLDYAGGDVGHLGHPAELRLIRRLIQLPELVENAAQTLEPHHFPHYALDLADEFHGFYEQCRVISEDAELSRARLKLVKATQTVLANTLRIMGITAPERM